MKDDWARRNLNLTIQTLRRCRNEESFSIGWQLASAMSLKLNIRQPNSQFKLREARYPDTRHCAPRGGTPLYGLYRYVRPQRVWFFSLFGHKLGIDFSNFAAILVINRVFIFCTLVGFFLRTSYFSSRPPSPTRALPSSTPFNACYAG